MLVRQEYGTSEAYLRLALGWPAEETESTEDETVASKPSDRYWTSTDEVVVRANDWPYSIPHDVSYVAAPSMLPPMVVVR